ncbi:hypothetical protein E4U60_001492 [Claviceps pazoutovae]|uniref:Uncharacterized protein n=1 Tax=Claviceps pazoutovae TaxID=1649127 RepID=A0A9P7MII4_9HYPO|nr:hypothetical protein E4U60_001492 [Claviceps pazoutovae]
MSAQMEIDSGSGISPAMIQQITDQILVHQNELQQLREEKAAMQQQLSNLMSAPQPPPASTPAVSVVLRLLGDIANTDSSRLARPDRR